LGAGRKSGAQDPATAGLWRGYRRCISAKAKRNAFENLPALLEAEYERLTDNWAAAAMQMMSRYR
jgi:hypothetical protein